MGFEVAGLVGLVAIHVETHQCYFDTLVSALLLLCSLGNTSNAYKTSMKRILLLKSDTSRLFLMQLFDFKGDTRF